MSGGFRDGEVRGVPDTGQDRTPRWEVQWFGYAGHFIASRWCYFHLATLVGPWLVSTVGDYHPPRSDYSVDAESPRKTIGWERDFETYVFRAGPTCHADGCDCGMPSLLDAEEVETHGAMTAGAATRNHYAMCEKYTTISANETEEETV